MTPTRAAKLISIPMMPSDNPFILAYPVVMLSKPNTVRYVKASAIPALNTSYLKYNGHPL